MKAPEGGEGELFPLYCVVPVTLAGSGFALDDRIYGF
jgi:hypothetical protein